MLRYNPHLNDFTTAAAWLQFLEGRDPLDNPFDAEPLGQSPVFLYSQNPAPLPSAAMAGMWTAYPTAQKLSAHLRFGLLPADFAIWLCRDEWDTNLHIPKLVEDIFAGARKAENQYTGDLPTMQRIIDLLDASMAATDDAAAWGLLENACQTFNSGWQSTPTWNFVHQPLRGREALIVHMTEKDAANQKTLNAVVSLASSPESDAQLRSLLSESIVC